MHLFDITHESNKLFSHLIEFNWNFWAYLESYWFICLYLFIVEINFLNSISIYSTRLSSKYVQ